MSEPTDDDRDTAVEALLIVASATGECQHEPTLEDVERELDASPATFALAYGVFCAAIGRLGTAPAGSRYRDYCREGAQLLIEGWQPGDQTVLIRLSPQGGVSVV